MPTETVADIKVYRSEAEQLLEFVVGGTNVELAAKAAGLSADEFGELMKGDAEFAKQVDKARYTVLAQKEQRLDTAGKRGDWKADMAALQAAKETRESYGRDPVGGGTTINVILNVPDPQRIVEVQGEVIEVDAG